MKHHVLRTWDRISIYFPVLLMGVLALGTWWLVRNPPRVFEAPAARPVVHEPDYVMTDFSVKSFDRLGHLQSDIKGPLAKHFPDTDTMEMESPDLRSLSPEGVVTTATARQGIGNSDFSEVQLIGNARVVRDASKAKGKERAPLMTYEGEFLHAWVKEERVQSHLPVVLTRGEDRFTGERMDYDNLSQVVRLQGRVRGVLVPEPKP